MTAGVIRLICSRTYHQDSLDHLGDSRVYDILASEPDLADRIEADMQQHGWETHREEL